MLLAVPKTKNKLYGERSFAARTPRLLNAPPVGINLDGKQVNCLVCHPIENRPLRGHEVTVSKNRSAKPMKVYPASRVLTFSLFVFS